MTVSAGKCIFVGVGAVKGREQLDLVKPQEHPCRHVNLGFESASFTDANVALIM